MKSFEQDHKLRELLKALPDLIFILDGEGNYLEVVSEQEEMLFAEPGSLPGRSLWEALPKREAELLVEFVRDTIAGKADKFIEYALPLPKGMRWYEARAAAIEYGPEGEPAAVFISRDVTDRVRAQKEVELQSQVTQLLATADVFEDAMKSAIRAICQHSIWDFGVAWFMSPKDEVLHWRAAWWPKDKKVLVDFVELSRELEFALGEGLPGRVWKAGKAEWISNLAESPKQLFPHADKAMKIGIRTAAGVPVMADKRVEAVLTFFHFESREEDEVVLETLTTAANQTSIALQRIRAERELQDLLAKMEKMALQDSLTGIFNRRAISNFAENEWLRSKRKNIPLSLIFLDLDNLKEINDKYGHLCGDEAIKRVAAVASREKRSYDQIGRWGGDEFLILLPDTNKQQAKLVMERMLKEIQSEQIELPDGGEFGLQISIGMASIENPAEDEEQTLETLFEQADAALYQDKPGKSRTGTLKRDK